MVTQGFNCTNRSHGELRWVHICLTEYCPMILHSSAYLMPMAHGPIFCCKELREKVGVKVRFFIGSESAHTDRLFITDKTWDLPCDFLSECHLAHTARFFSRELLCLTMAGEVTLLDYVTPIFLSD